jgi:tetratricopeptide (TPR) repeat protein
MSLLSRLILLGALLTILVGSYWLFENRKEHKRSVQLRYESFLQKSHSETQATIAQLLALLDAKEISENELLLLFELCLESPKHSIHTLMPAWATMRSDQSLRVDRQIIEECIRYREGDIAGSQKKLEQLFKDNPASRRANYEFQKVMFLVGTIDKRVMAKRALFNLSKSQDRWSYKALRLLSFSPPSPGMLKEDLIRAMQKLKAHPMVTSEDLLKASQQLIQLDESIVFDHTFEELKVLKKDQLNPTDFGYWLIQLGRPGKALEVVSQADSLADEDFFFIRFQALMETNQTIEAENLLQKVNHLSAGKKLQAEAYLKLAQDDGNAITEFLQGAQNLNSAKSLLDVSRLALLKGNGEVAYKAFQQAWEIGPAEFNLSQANQFLQISLVSRNTKEAHKITGEIFRRFPEKFGNANNYCYLSLLLGENIEKQEKETERITQAFPSSPTFLSTLALAKLLNGKAQEALDVMNERGPIPLNHGERALLACILEASGNNKEAKKMADKLEELRMLPEEWALLEKYGLAGA